MEAHMAPPLQPPKPDTASTLSLSPTSEAFQQTGSIRVAKEPPLPDEDLWTEPLDSRDLTWIAEAAHGQLDEDLELVRIGDAFRLRKRQATTRTGEPSESIGKVVLRIRTSSLNRNQRKPAEVNIRLESDGDEIALAEECD